MNIVIVGDGKVGYTLSEHLNSEGHSITIIDNNAETLNASLETLDVMGVHGNGASLDVQMEAGVADADLLIAATSADELNMICCLIGKHLGAERTIARVRNPEYSSQLQMLKEQFGLSMAINPELEAAREIARIIKFPPALKIETFSKGRVELVEFKLRAGMPVVGRSLMEIPSLTRAKVLICAVERGGEVVIPGGNFVLRENDHIHITGASGEIVSFLAEIGGVRHKVRALMIVGGGRIAYYLVKMLDERVVRVKIIEKKRERCDELCDLLPQAVVIHGDGADIEVLESEGIRNMDAFAALSNIDEENLVMSMLASEINVPKIITKTGRFQNFSILGRLGIDTVINPKMTTANTIIQYVRAVQNSAESSNIKTLHKLVNGKAEAVEFTASRDTRNLGMRLNQLNLKRNLLVAVLVRGSQVIIPHGQDSIKLGDSVVVLTNEHKLNQLNDIFA